MIGSQATCRNRAMTPQGVVGRGAYPLGRSRAVRTCGLMGSDYADMSNEKTGGNPVRRNPKVSRGRFVLPGSAGPKPRPKGVGDGQRVNIPAPEWRVIPMGKAVGKQRLLMDASRCNGVGAQENPRATRPRCIGSHPQGRRGCPAMPTRKPPRNCHPDRTKTDTGGRVSTYPGARVKPR